MHDWHIAGVEREGGGEEEEMIILCLWAEGDSTAFFRLGAGTVRYGGQRARLPGAKLHL